MPSAATVRATPAVEHGIAAPVVKRPFGKFSADPVLNDHLAAGVGLALDLCTTQVKQLAKAAGISPQRASAWRTEGKGNPVFEITSVVYHLTRMGQHPGALIGQIHTAMYQGMLGTSDVDLVRRFWTLMEQESVKEGRENAAAATFANTGDLERLERTKMDEAATEFELAALSRELRRRNIDPRNPAFN